MTHERIKLKMVDINNSNNCEVVKVQNGYLVYNNSKFSYINENTLNKIKEIIEELSSI